MHLNSTHLVRGAARTLLEKAHIWEADLPSPVRPGASLHMASEVDDDNEIGVGEHDESDGQELTHMALTIRQFRCLALASLVAGSIQPGLRHSLA